MDVIEIDGAKALTLLREIVEGHEDFVYDFPQEAPKVARCVYQHNGKPSCLVGQALAKAGVSIEELSKMDNPDNAFEPSSIGNVRLPERLVLKDFAREIFSVAQIEQDARGSWGNALYRAENRAANAGIEVD